MHALGDISETAQAGTEDEAGRGFRGHRFGPADLGALPSILSRSRGDGRELLAIVQLLTRRPAGSWTSLGELHASLGGAGMPKRRTIRGLWELFLGVADARLQRLYRRYLAENPPPAGASHYAKIAHLAGVEAEAQSIVDRHEWEWLAGWLDLGRVGGSAERSIERLSNLALRVSTVNFRFTYHCNIACRHCYNSSGPGRKGERIALEDMLAIVGQMPGAGLRRLILTGGEPFLYPGDVIALIRAARAAQVQRISINSNGYWASSDERARQMLERLAEAGFMLEPEDNLKISSGIYHTEFVDLDRIFKLARCYHERFGRPVIVDFELEAGAPHARDAAIERFRAAGLLDRVDLQFRTISPLGRARQFEDLPASDCAVPCGIIDQIVFDPDGLVRPCCGLNNENFGVAVGRLAEHGLRDLVKRAQNDPVLQFLSRKPMNAIFEELGRSPKPQGYAGICDLCQHAIGDLRDKEPLQARLFAGQRFYPFWFTQPR
jgi:hypothetical protein